MNHAGKIHAAPVYALGAALFSVTVLFSSVSEAEWEHAHHHIPEAVRDGSAQFVNAVPEEKRMLVSIVLPQRNTEKLEQLLNDIYNPQNPQYHHYLGVSEFTEQFGPTQADYDKVIGFAQKNGLVVKKTYANRMSVDVEGPVSAINNALHVRMHHYQRAEGGHTFYAPDREPSPDMDGVQPLQIAGLSNYYLPRHHIRLPDYKSLAISPRMTGSGPQGNYLGSDMRAAYYGGTTLTGKGQSVGILEFGGVNPKSIELYFQTIKQPLNVSVNRLSVDGSPVDPLVVNGQTTDDTEQALDIEQVISMAPGLDQVKVYSSNTTEVPIFQAMANDAATVKVFSISWGVGITNKTADEQIFKQMAAQGQTIFVASGDDGAYTNNVSGSQQCANPNSQNCAVYPADSALVISVGATHLTTTGPGGRWVSETAWTCPGGNGGGCSGGGHAVSGISIPSWQQLPGVITSANQGSTTVRNSPDVAMEGDQDNFVCSNNNGTGVSCFGGVAGTSFAAPRWAGYFALVNEDAVSRGDQALGFINQELYNNIGVNAANYALAFHPITNGSNGQNSTGFKTMAGYNLVTGWGSPNSKLAP